MRILFCTNSLGAKGGLERVTIVKANALADIPGNEVAICFTDKGTYPEETIHPLSSKVHVYDLGVPFWDLYPLNLKNLLINAPRKFLALRRALKRRIKEFRPDIVITTGSYEKYGLATLRLGKDTVKIREYHFNSNYRDYIGCSKLLKLAGWVDNNVLSRFFDKNFLLTKEDKDANFRNNRKFDYQYNPCSFSVNRQLTDEREDIVIAVGRLVDQKNISSLLRIWHKASPKCPGWSLKIAGEGNQREMLETMVGELGVVGSVEFLGFRKDIPELLAKSKVLAMTSKYEGFGVNIVEAMRLGVVPISYRTSYGPSDVITDNTNGILVDYNDEAQFVEKLVSLINDGPCIERMSKEAIERASDFDAAKIAQQWMQKYQALREVTPTTM